MAMLLGADGKQEVGIIQDAGGCCPVKLCALTHCAVACLFIRLLPSGPMWDIKKSETISNLQTTVGPNGEIRCDLSTAKCGSMVLFAIYVAGIFYDTLQDLVFAERESNPYTAYDTMPQWLDRLGWVDCYSGLCRSPELGAQTPYEYMTACGPAFCPPNAPQALQDTINHGIIVALSRLQMGGIKTLDWLNWVVEPLGATLVFASMQAGCAPCFNLTKIGETIPSWTKPLCGTNQIQPPIPSFYMSDVCGTASPLIKIYPGILAAECIIRSLLPKKSLACLQRLV
jgi:hypothetical protein